jgi:lysophospholipase L1-like esterase
MRCLSSAVRAEAPLQILSLVDSYTISTSVTEAGRWPHLLQQQLKAEGLDVAAPEIIACNGWTSRQLLKRVSAGTERSVYDLVTLLIGLNNQFPGQSSSRFANQLD